MRTLAIIPARYESTRLPGKLLLDLQGKPVLQHTYLAVSSSDQVNHVVVATDNSRILETVKKFGGNTIETGECATGTDRVVEALSSFEKQCITSYDIVVNVQGDEPKVNPSHIDLCISALRNDPSAVMSTLVTPIVDAKEAMDRNVVKCVADRKGNALYFSRALIPHSKTGDFEPTTLYLRHIGLYAFRKDFLMEFTKLPKSELEDAEDLEQLRILEAGEKIKVVQVDFSFPGIDTLEQLESMRQLL